MSGSLPPRITSLSLYCTVNIILLNSLRRVHLEDIRTILYYSYATLTTMASTRLFTHVIRTEPDRSGGYGCRSITVSFRRRARVDRGRRVIQKDWRRSGLSYKQRGKATKVKHEEKMKNQLRNETFIVFAPVSYSYIIITFVRDSALYY